ncbi:hypothetical protein ACHAXR_009809 [Thalassiosira sp. AJA248-18]
MVALIRSVQLLALIFVHFCVVKVHCWSATSLFFGSGDEDVDVDIDDVKDRSDGAPPKRTLASFEQHSHSIPIGQAITPRGRRDIEASVKAHTWPTTIFSPLCEAWAYLEAGAFIGKAKSSSQTTEEEGNDSLAWRYLDALVEQGGIPSLDRWVDESNVQDSKENAQLWTFQNSTSLAADTASRASKSALDEHLIPMALSLRAHSPHCEMHRSLARDAAITFGVYNINTVGSLPAAFSLVSRVGKDDGGAETNFVLGTQVILDASLLPAAISTLQSEDIKGESREGEGSSLFMPLPEETFHPTALVGDSNIVAILYGQMGTTAFASLYQSLKDSQIKFVVRHMGHVPYEEETKMSHDGKANTRATPTVLQGYGVRLDIRNVEYKAFDDGPDDKDKDGDTEPDWNEAGHSPEDPARDEPLAGVNLHTLLGRLNDADSGPLPSDLQALQTALIQSHPTQLRSESIVPPAWQRRPLSLQAATVVAASSDPLETLKGVSQNLPSVAHSLSNVQVPKAFEDLAEEASNLATKVGAISPGWGDAAFGLFINSRPVDVERPSFNVFQLLDVIREEDQRLSDLEMKARPMLKNTMSMLGRSDDTGAGAEWPALQAVRKVFDMGAEKLAQMGKKGMFGDEKSIAKDPEDYYGDGEEEEDKSPSEKYRIDVARGGKNAVIYLNDIEKDPEYKSWPASMQEMFYRSQFGGAPTVRRNLFTMLAVIDPAATETANPALDAVGQLMNSQFPLRLGVLIVNDDDVSNGSPSPPAPWNNGDRHFHARDSSLLLKYISKAFGGMAAISCLIHSSHAAAESGEISVREYIGIYLSVLIEMGVIHSGQKQHLQQEIEVILESGTTGTDTKPNDVNYEAAVQFAADKLVRPGMSFFNGIPLPDGSNMESFGAGLNEILQYEQRHIMNLAMKNVITDTKPRSIYASLLKGDKLFKQYHPLVRETAGEYSVVSPKSDWRSLMLPKTSAPFEYSNVDAIFLIEGVFDLDNPGGFESAVSFLDLISSPPEAWHDSKRVSVAFRVLSSGLPMSPNSQVINNIFCDASQFDIEDIKGVVKTLQSDIYDNVADAIATIEQIKDFSGHVLQKIVEAAKKECPVAKTSAPEKNNFYVANGRVYVPIGDSSLSASDIKMLINLEIDKTHAMTKLITPHLLPATSGEGGDSNVPEGHVIHHAIGTSAAILNDIMSASSSSSSNSHDSAAAFDSLQTDSGNPLYLSWNDGSSSSGHLQVEVSVILDPLTEPTQRVAPLLIAIRDFLKLPLRLILAPRKIVSNDVPLSSYYRFVADPTAFPDSSPPKSLFQNLPTNHLLTLRMDVPELWDVQQAHTIQDADNLRCDARFGCGDEAHVLANNEGERDQGGTKQAQRRAVESTQIEYSLKSLLFFGQCYDVSQSTPPNGLQLTLDRSKSNDTSESESTTETEIEPDGSQHMTGQNLIATQAEHTDTLVMKTVGYWQLRANAGVWDLRIAEQSRGAEIYHMVDGTVGKSGSIRLAKNSAETTSKTLIMKDFTNLGRLLLVKRREGYEQASLFGDEVDLDGTQLENNETVHVFSLATGHAYERLLKIMMLSVTKRTTSPVKFWLFENFLSPSFKSSAKYMAKQIGCEVEFVTYKWPEWLRGQSEKQRIIWGYKILFLDVLFPLDVKKIIYVDADQVVRGDLTELWNLDLEGAPYGYTPFCDSREETLGYQFWRTGFWQSHLRGRPYHISALYVVDLERFRRELVGDKLRSTYQSLSADPNSLSNLDQDLPNYAQHDVRIFSLPQKWLWCESWCSDETKAEAMTIDLCNNPQHKEPKISMAKRIISGDLFDESWEELDAEVARYNQDFLEYEKVL